MTNPTPENPLIVVSVSDKGVPSMKNDNQLNFKTGKMTRSNATKVFLRGFTGKVKAAMNQKGFSMLSDDTPIGLYVYMKLAKQDGDNVFTTIQETMQKSIVNNDRQVKFGQFVVNDIDQGMTEMAVAFVWELPQEARTDKDVAIDAFLRFYMNVYMNKPISRLIADYQKGL